MRLAAFMALELLFLGVMTFKVLAQNMVFWSDGYGQRTTITLQPTEKPGAVAEVVFVNRYVNDARHNTDNVLALDGLSVVATFTYNADSGGADRIVVTPPEGYIAIPEELTLPEGRDGVLYIYSDQSVGY